MGIFISLHEGENIMNLKEIDRLLVTNSVVRSNFDILNPINKLQEFAKFSADKTYNPQFKYNQFDQHSNLQELESLDIPTDSKLGALMENIRTNLLREGKALKYIGSPKFNDYKLFLPVPQKVVTRAYEILEMKEIEEDTEEKTVSALQLAAHMQKQLDRYHCSDWKIVFSEHAAARVSVSAGRKQVTIRADDEFSELDVTKLLVHEIGTHVLRAINGLEQEYSIFAIGLPGYLATEEGLAGYNERVNGVKRHSTLRYYALSALITHLCASKGFVEVFHLVRKYFDEDWMCFKAVARPKRGLGDTSLPGGYLKDHCYLEGLMIIEEFVKTGGDVKELYAGKIGIQHLHFVHDGTLKPAKIIPDFLK